MPECGPPMIYKIFQYSVEGKRYKIQQILKKGFTNIDLTDVGGNTALYYACLNKNRSTAKLLLDYNANPNERCGKGKTPVHAAIISGDTKLLGLLIRYGGDLRLHDDDGRNARDYIMLMDNTTVKRSLLKYLEEIRNFAMLQTSARVQKPVQGNENLNAFSAGYGTLLKKANDVGAPIIATHINEHELVHDEGGITVNNGAFMVFESVLWKDKIKATIKRLHNIDARIDGAYVDLLIREQNVLSKISFPRIIQLIGISKSPNLDGQSLVFESVRFGSLFNLLHDNLKSFSARSIYEIMSHICDALIYLHEQGIVHCYVNTHSILLVDSHSPKLANFEYAVEKSSDPNLQKKSKVIENIYTNCAYNWLAPEIMTGANPTPASDMYSFCSVIWELYNKNIPWRDMEWSYIKKKVVEEEETLPVDFNLIPLPINRIIKDGLGHDTINRMTFEEVKFNLDNHRYCHNPQKKTIKRQQSNNVTDNNNNCRKSLASFSEGIGSINEAVNSQEMTNLSSMDEYDRFSDSKSFILCDKYKAEFHLTKGPHAKQTRGKEKVRVNRASSNNYDRKRNSTVESHNRSKTRSPKSTDVHLDSIGLISVNTSNMNKRSPGPHASPMHKPQAPPPPPAPPIPDIQAFTRNSEYTRRSFKTQYQTHDSLRKDQTSSHKPPLGKQYTKTPIQQTTLPMPLPPNHLTPNTTPNSNKAPQTPYTNDTTNIAMNHTPKSLIKPTVSAQNLLEELRTRLEENPVRGNGRPEDLLDSLYLKSKQQQQEFSDETSRHQDQILIQRKQLQQQQILQKQHERQQGEYQFEPNYENQPTQQVSTPIHTNTRPSYFDRENPFRKSINLGENLQKATPDDKMRYFNRKQNLDITSTKNKIEKKLDMEELSAIEGESETDYDGQNLNQESDTNEDKKKLLYSSVKKTTPMREGTEQFDETKNQQQYPLQQNYTIDNFSRLGKELRDNYLQQKDEYIQQQFTSKKPSKPTNLPINEQPQLLEKKSSPCLTDSKQTIPLPRRLQSLQKLNQEDKDKESRYSNRLKSSSLGPASSVGSANDCNEPFFAGFGSVKNLVESYEGIPHKEQSEAETKLMMIREQRRKEINEALLITKHDLIKDGLDDDDYDQDDNQDEEEEQILSEQEQLEYSLRLVEESEKKVSQFIQRAPTQQYQHQQQLQPQQHQQNQLQSKDLSTISEKTENSYTINNQMIAGSNTSVTSPMNNTNNTNAMTNSKGTMLASVTKSIRHLDPNRYLDTSTGCSGDGFSTRNGNTPNSTPKQLLSPEKNFKINSDGDQELYLETVRNRTKLYNQEQARQHFEAQSSKKQTYARQQQQQQPQTQYNPNNQHREHESDVTTTEQQQTTNQSVSPRRYSETHRSSNKNRVNSDGQFTSQEDILSITTNQELNMTEIDSYQSYLDTFENCKNNKLLIKSKKKTGGDRKDHHYEDQLEIEQELLEQDFPSLPEHLTKPLVDNNHYEQLNSESTPMQSPLKKANTILPASVQNNYAKQQKNSRRLHELSIKPNPDTTDNHYRIIRDLEDDEQSSCSTGAASSVSSRFDQASTDNDYENNNKSPDSRKNKQGTCRLDTVYIDTSKYQGYQCKIETKSKESNQYQIESRLTNEKTGHSFLLAKTRVKTPKLSTKVFIDQ